MSTNQDDVNAQIEAKKKELEASRQMLETINARIERLREEAASDPDFDPSDASTEGGRKAIMEDRVKELEEEIRRLESQ